jgi:hypothetical protein
MWFQFLSVDKSKTDNYRPISLLSNFSKILEKIVSNRIIVFLENNNLISNPPFGLWKIQSTLHPMVHFMNFISNAQNKKKYAMAMFCNLRKAFDTFDHTILLKKMK